MITRTGSKLETLTSEKAQKMYEHYMAEAENLVDCGHGDYAEKCRNIAKFYEEKARTLSGKAVCAH